MAMPDFNLIDHIGWATTRRIPLCEEAVYKLLLLVRNTYTFFIEEFAGISQNNSLEYVVPLNEISNDEKFFNDAQNIILDHNLLNFLEFEYLFNNELLDSVQVSSFLNAVKITPEFSGFYSELQGINDMNNQDYKYRRVIERLMVCPKFLRDAETFSITKIK